MRHYSEYRANHLYRLALEHRVRKLETLFLEGKRDQEILRDFLGDDYYDKYTSIKNKIKDTEYKDIYKLIKMDPNEVKDYIDSFQSNTSARRSKKSDGAKLIYQDDLWKVYRITTYKAAQLYGYGTRWCITGRYEDHEERGEEYFYGYIKNNDLDGGYYFYIKNDGRTKYCLLRRENGAVHSIWDASDNELNASDIIDIEEDFPAIEGVFIPQSPNSYPLFSDNIEVVRNAIRHGENINERCTNKNTQYYGYTPIDWHLEHSYNTDNKSIFVTLLSSGANITKTSQWKLIFNWFPKSIIKIAWNRGLNKAADLSEMISYAIDSSSVDLLMTLLDLGNVDANAKLSDGKSLLYHEITCKGGASVSAIKELIKYGSDVNEILDNGETLLDLAKRTPKSSRPVILNLLENAMSDN